MKHKFNVLAIAMRYCLVICLVGHFMIETKLSAQNQSVIMPNSQSNCAGRGRLLFTEDFGGNDLSDPEIKASGIPQVDGYTYKTNLLGHGTYVIAKQNPVPYPGSWHQLSDHTHPNDRDRGYFLAFDATSAPGQLYEHQIDDLCDGTKLYFSTWIVSLMKIQGKHKGNLMFQIEDLNFKILAQYLTGDIPDGDPVWKNYGFEFTVPNGESSIILRIINNGAGSEGNDLAIDDIEVRFCSPSIMMSNQVADTLCYDQTFQLNASYIDDGSFTNGNNDMVYRWEYSQTSDFKNAVMLDGGIEKSSTINTNITVKNVTEKNEGYYRLIIGNIMNINYPNCIAISDPIFLKVKTIEAKNDVTLTVFDQPVNIDVLANDDLICLTDMNQLTIDTLAGVKPKRGSVVINANKTITYTPTGNSFGIDSIDYKITAVINNKIITDSARIYVVILRPLSDYNVLCPDAKLIVGMHQIPDVEYAWYDVPTGGNITYTNAEKEITKDASNEQSWYIEPIFRKIKLPVRYKLSVLKSDNCGTISPTGCAVNGKLLFREDFGGNNVTDPTVSAKPLAPGITSYKFIEPDNIKPGHYALVKTNTRRGTNAWQTNFSDHTYPNDNKRGYMFMVDASTTTGKFYEYEITGLCNNIDKLYFSIWVANLMATENKLSLDDPILKFELTDKHNNILGTYITSTVPREKWGNLKWRQYGFMFDPKNNSSVILRIYNNNLSSAGNDFVLDDIEMRLCLPHISMENNVKNDQNCSAAQSFLKVSYDDDGTFTGAGIDMAYRWEYSNDSIAWTTIGSDSVALSTIIRSQIYPAVKGYYRIVIGNVSMLDDQICRISSNAIYLDVTTPYKVPDLCLTILPSSSQRIVYLTSFIDTIDSPLIKWEKISNHAPNLIDDVSGALNTQELVSKMVYTYRYTVSTKCGTSSAIAYISTFDRRASVNGKIIFICKDLESSKYVQLNQILRTGSDGQWFYPDDTEGIVKNNVTVSSPKYAGARIFNAQKAYDEAMQTTSYAATGKPEVKAFKFKFVPTNGQSCVFVIIAGKK